MSFVLLNVIVREPIQSNLVYFHKLSSPSGSISLNEPEAFGFKPHQVYNFHLPSTDKVTLGLWHILPKSIYAAEVQKTDLESKYDKDFYLNQLKSESHDVVLYLHNSGVTRANKKLFNLYKTVTETLDKNLIVLDYRGFADSTGTPNEQGLFKDSLMVFNQLVAQGILPSRIHIVGQGLGATLAVKLTAYLNNFMLYPKSLILLEPTTSVQKQVLEFKLFDTLPLLLPLVVVPQINSVVDRKFNHKFDVAEDLKMLQTATLVLYNEYDSVTKKEEAKNVFELSTQGLIFSSTTEDETNKEIKVLIKDTEKVVQLTQIANNNLHTVTGSKAFANQINNFWNKL